MAPQASKLKTEKPTSGKPAAPAPQTVEQRVETINKSAEAIKVETPEQSREASKVMREAAILRRDIEAEYKQRRKPHWDAQQKLSREEKALTAKLLKVEQAIAALIKKLDDQIEAEQRAKVEAERTQREEAAKAEAALRADQLRAAAATAAPSVKKRLLAQADVVQNAQPIIDPIQIEEKPQLLAEGIHARKGTVHGAVDSLESLVLQVAARIMLEKFGGTGDPVVAAFLQMFKPSAQATIAVLQPSMPEIHRLAVAFPSDLELAGVRVVEDESSLVARR